MKCYVLPIALACNADCVFCVSKTYGLEKVGSVMLVDDAFDDTLAELGKRDVSRFEITGGGEPTLHKHLDRIIQKIYELDDGVFIKLYTNGVKLVRIGMIDEINISRVHWDNEVNDRYMRFRKPSMSLERVSEWYRKTGAKTIRLSIPLIPGVIDSREKVLEFVSRTERFVDRYVCRPLYPFTPLEEFGRVDISLDHHLIEVDLEACADNRSNLIWSTDHTLYRSWQMKANDIVVRTGNTSDG